MIKIKEILNNEEKLNKLISGLKYCPKKDVQLLFNSDKETFKSIIFSIINYYYSEYEIYNKMMIQGKILRFMESYTNDIFTYKEKYKFNITPDIIINSLYYKNIKEIYIEKEENKEEFIIYNIKKSITEEDKEEITRILLEHVQEIFADLFSIRCQYFPIENKKIINRLKDF
jgi:hypothetical protein